MTSVVVETQQIPCPSLAQTGRCTASCGHAIVPLTRLHQVAVVFGGAFLVGVFLGIMFGQTSDPDGRKEYEQRIILSIPIGTLIGFAVGFANQWLRSAESSKAMFSTNYDRLPISRNENDDY